jgi:hypothetical protein
MNALNLVTIELNSGFDIGEEISVKVPEGILTMTVVDIEEFDVDGEDDFGNYNSGTVYAVLEAKNVKLDGKEGVYTDKHVNEMFTKGFWSITYTEGHRSERDHGGYDRY